MLSKEQFYKRRWFLAILFLMSGLWLIYMAYGMFGYHKAKEDLIFSTTKPVEFYIEKSDETKNRFLYLVLTNKKISAVVEQYQIDLLQSIMKIDEYNSNSLKKNSFELNDFSFEYRYWKDRLYELKVNKNVIIEFEKVDKTIAFVVLGIGILWTAFQAWVIFTLSTKGISIYDKSFKK